MEGGTMFRFTIRELLILTVTAGLAVGWWMDHRANAANAEAAEDAEFLAQYAANSVCGVGDCSSTSHCVELQEKYGAKSPIFDSPKRLELESEFNRNRRAACPEHALAGGLFQCAYCGQSITGERIRRNLKGGGVREHLYYRCANNRPGPDHPTVRWKDEDLERAVVDDLASLRLPTPEIATWFRSALQAAVLDVTSHQRRQAAALAKRRSELAAMQDRLLNAYLAGTVEEVAFTAKSNELKAVAAKAGEALAQVGDGVPARAETALVIFGWAQTAADSGSGS